LKQGERMPCPKGVTPADISAPPAKEKQPDKFGNVTRQLRAPLYSSLRLNGFTLDRSRLAC